MLSFISKHIMSCNKMMIERWTNLLSSKAWGSDLRLSFEHKINKAPVMPKSTFFQGLLKVPVMYSLCVSALPSRQQWVSGWWHQHHRRRQFNRLARRLGLRPLEEDLGDSRWCEQHPLCPHPRQGLQLPLWALAQAGQGRFPPFPAKPGSQLL